MQSDNQLLRFSQTPEVASCSVHALGVMGEALVRGLDCHLSCPDRSESGQGAIT